MTTWVEGHFVAGDVALDLANTVYRRWPEPGADLLPSAEALGAWLVAARLLPGGAGPADSVDLAALDEARALRSRLWAAFDAQRAGADIPAPAFAGLLDAARRGSARVGVGADGSLVPADARGALAILALRAVRLVLDPPLRGVRACEGCGWLFVDASRGRRRRWCSMQTCGNRAKAARYRAAHAPTAAGATSAS